MTGPSDCCLLPPGAAKRSLARRRRVIDAARLLFADNGFHATGIAQIAKVSEIAVGQIYRDFASKEEIVAAIVETDCGAFMRSDLLNDAVARGDADSVRAWIHQFVDPKDKADNGRMFVEIVAESSRNERIARIFTTLQAEVRANLMTALSLFAPGEAMAMRRSIIADTISVMSLGLLHQRLMHPEMDFAILVPSLVAIVDRSIADLARESPLGESIAA